MSSIKEFIEPNKDNEEGWINYIIEQLQGTCNTLSPYEDEYVAEGYNLDTLFSSLDEAIMCCPTCGWWVETSEMVNDEECNDCYEDED